MENVLISLIATIVPLATLILARRAGAGAGGSGTVAGVDAQTIPHGPESVAYGA